MEAKLVLMSEEKVSLRERVLLAHRLNAVISGLVIYEEISEEMKYLYTCSQIVSALCGLRQYVTLQNLII